MKLNGWQRLWILVAAIWMLLVLALAWGAWPTPARVSAADVYAKMSPSEGRWLTDYNAIMGISPAGPPGVRSWSDLDNEVTNRKSAYVDGQKLEFWGGASTEDQRQTVLAFRASLRRILVKERVVLLEEAFGLWVAPLVALYALGLGIGWVSRGFAANRSGHAN